MGDPSWYILVLIFVARICDVSIGTVRLIYVISGWRWRAAVLGFVEVVIWVLAVGGLVSYLTSPLAVISFAGGFSVGTVVGMTIEQKLAFGIRLVRVVNRDLERDVSSRLRERGYRVTRVDGEGKLGPVEIAFAVVRRRSLVGLMDAIEGLAPEAVVTVERADYASAASLSRHDADARSRLMNWAGLLRK